MYAAILKGKALEDVLWDPNVEYVEENGVFHLDDVGRCCYVARVLPLLTRFILLPLIDDRVEKVLTTPAPIRREPNENVHQLGKRDNGAGVAIYILGKMRSRVLPSK